MAKKAPSFEEALARLETIAAEIEEGEIGLEQSIQKYEEGMKLVHRCREVLQSAEQRIIKLQAEHGSAAGPSDPPAPDSSSTAESES